MGFTTCLSTLLLPAASVFYSFQTSNQKNLLFSLSSFKVLCLVFNGYLLGFCPERFSTQTNSGKGQTVIDLNYLNEYTRVFKLSSHKYSIGIVVK